MPQITTPQITIRQIIKTDNAPIAKIIRQSLIDFNAAKPGTVFNDPTTDNLFELFKAPKSHYFIALQGNTVIGGCGLYPTLNLPSNTCELVKLYLHLNFRGKGHGKLLLQKTMQKATELGYQFIYLETMPELKAAIPLYQKLGFTYLPNALGNSGHTSCNVFMVKAL